MEVEFKHVDVTDSEFSTPFQASQKLILSPSENTLKAHDAAHRKILNVYFNAGNFLIRSIFEI